MSQPIFPRKNCVCERLSESLRHWGKETGKKRLCAIEEAIRRREREKTIHMQRHVKKK